MCPRLLSLGGGDGELMTPESNLRLEKLADSNRPLELLGVRRVKRLRKGEYALVRVAAESVMRLNATHLAIIDYLGSVPKARTADIIAATGRSRPAINCALGDLIYAKEQTPRLFQPPPYMHWHRRRSGGDVLASSITLKNGKALSSVLDRDPERAQALIVPMIKKLIRAGQLDRHSDVAELYLHRRITKAELEPTYMYWAGARGVWRSKIPLKNGKELNRALDADRERAAALMASFITALVAAGKLDRDHPAAKLYLDRTITGTEPNHDPTILNADRGPKSATAPPCMRWMDGTSEIDDGLQYQRIKCRVLWSQIRLRDGSVLQVRLAPDPKQAAARLRRHVLKAVADGNLSPDSKAAKVYGGAEDGVPAVRPAHRGQGRKAKWINGKGAVSLDARKFFDVVTAARAGGPIKVGIENGWDEIPNSQKMTSSGRPMQIRSMTNRYIELERAIAGDSPP
jgi:hypothetical protein